MQPDLRAGAGRAAGSLTMRLTPFARARRGVVAVEFALLAVPFFMLLLGTLEIAIQFVSQTALDHALETNARLIKTGEAQNATPPMTADTFKDRVCDSMKAVIGAADCNRLHVDVRSFSGFGDVNPPAPPVSDGSFDDDATTFDPGGPEETVLVRAFYEYQVVTPLMSMFLSDLDDDIKLLTSADLFRSEPFS